MRRTTTVVIPRDLSKRIKEEYGSFVSVSGFVQEAVREKLEKSSRGGAVDAAPSPALPRSAAPASNQESSLVS
jgi:Arc/MetJ-type ribon-helix-helix transcriptional regulator